MRRVRCCEWGASDRPCPIGGVPVATEAAPSAPGRPAALAADAALLGPASAPTGVLAIVLVTLASVVVTLLRRRVVRRRLREVVVARLATLRAPPGPDAAPDHGPIGGLRDGPERRADHGLNVGRARAEHESCLTHVQNRA